MILEALHDVFVVLKWLFGFGALVMLLGIGLVLLWFVARAVVVRILRHQATDRFAVLRKLFLDMIVSYVGFPPHPAPRIEACPGLDPGSGAGSVPQRGEGAIIPSFREEEGSGGGV